MIVDFNELFRFGFGVEVPAHSGSSGEGDWQIGLPAFLSVDRCLVDELAGFFHDLACCPMLPRN